MLTRVFDVARMLDETISTLRFWEKTLHIPVPRSPGGQRHYSPKEVARLRLVKRLVRTEGYTLAGVKARLRDLDGWR